MKVLLIGSGGREHALAWKLRQSPLLKELYCAPGNPGIAQIADVVPIPADEIHQLADFAADLSIDLAVVGPELPLDLGIVDEFIGRGLAIFGPRKQAAELEGSKVFAKEFMRRHQIPTADFDIAHNAEDARRIAKRFGLPVVLKADGLAAGKGVTIPKTEEELDRDLQIFFEDRRFGAAADRLVVEEFLPGEEVSFIALCDGQRVLPFAASKDYKRLLDGDKGPNTGGMGAHSPSGLISGDAGAKILEQVIKPTVQGMDVENRAFTGFLYAGLMLTEKGPRVLEYNVRLGDPEAQALLIRLESDLLPFLNAAAHGRCESEMRLRFRKEAAACLVLASKGYPERPIKGETITGIPRAEQHEGVVVFHAGTATNGDQILAAGGRVLNVCAGGPTLRDALRRAYLGAAEIRWPNKFVRQDIGRRVIESGH